MQFTSVNFIRDPSCSEQSDLCEKIADYCLGSFRTATGCKTVKLITGGGKTSFIEQQKTADLLVWRIAAFAFTILTLPLAGVGFFALKFSATHQSIVKKYREECALRAVASDDSGQHKPAVNQRDISNLSRPDELASTGGSQGKTQAEVAFQPQPHGSPSLEIETVTTSPTELTDEQGCFAGLLPELIELILRKGGDFDSSRISKNWGKAALKDSVWRTIFQEIQLGQALTLNSKDGELHLRVRTLCKGYIATIAAMKTIPPDIKKLLGGHLSLQKMKFIMSWLRCLDRFWIMSRLGVWERGPNLFFHSSIVMEQGSSWNITLPIFLAKNPLELSLKFAKLATLPSGIWQFKKLKSLDLSVNNLRVLPDGISQLTDLQILSLEENNLMQLPHKIWELPNLTELSLDRNELTTLPPEILQLTSLKKLSLVGNPLTDMSDEIKEFVEKRHWIKASDFLQNQKTRDKLSELY